MKITSSQLKKIISEEVKRVLRESNEYDLLYTVADVLKEAGALDINIDEDSLEISFIPIEDEDEMLEFHDTVSVAMDKMGFEPEPGRHDISVFTDEISGKTITVDTTNGNAEIQDLLYYAREN